MHLERNLFVTNLAGTPVSAALRLSRIGGGNTACVLRTPAGFVLPAALEPQRLASGCPRASNTGAQGVAQTPCLTHPEGRSFDGQYRVTVVVLPPLHRSLPQVLVAGGRLGQQGQRHAALRSSGPRAAATHGGGCRRPQAVGPPLKPSRRRPRPPAARLTPGPNLIGARPDSAAAVVQLTHVTALMYTCCTCCSHSRRLVRWFSSLGRRYRQLHTPHHDRDLVWLLAAGGCCRGRRRYLYCCRPPGRLEHACTRGNKIYSPCLHNGEHALCRTYVLVLTSSCCCVLGYERPLAGSSRASLPCVGLLRLATGGRTQTSS